MNSVTQLQTTPHIQTSPAEKAAITSDFQTFLKMLTTQMQNQDPLNPMQSTEFATQLATFSGVEQQIRTNAWLQTIAGAGGTNSLAAMSGVIGMEVEVPSPAYFDGSSMTLRADIPAEAVGATLHVHTPQGSEVTSIPWPQDSPELIWKGSTASGTAITAGTYHFSLSYQDRNGELTKAEVRSFAQVKEVRLSEDGTGLLVLAGRLELPATAALALRRP